MAPKPPWSSPLRHGWTQAEPAREPVLFVNPRSGGGRAVHADLAAQASERAIDVVVLEPGADLRALALAAADRRADALGVAGGDGSLAVVAAVALERGLPFVCVPAGTRNHFALDLGIDRHDLIGALDAFTAGVERRIDVGRVNLELFLNNVSLGIYGDAVRQPEYRGAKVRTLLETAQTVLGPARATRDLRLVDDRGREHLDPAVVVVSNNPYALRQPIVTGTRPSLTGGQLGVVVLERPNAGVRDRREPARMWTASSLEVEASQPVHAGLDGESVELDPPLQFTIMPAALRVRISSRHHGISPSGLMTH